MKKLLVGIVLGAVALAGARFLFVRPEPPTHYHANFAIFVDGDRVDLSGDRYMIEKAAGCTVAAEQILPRQRVHLHDNNPDVVHVHHRGVTWGHFLANLGFGHGDRFLATDDGELLAEGEGRTLQFVLNGTVVPPAHNRLIRSGDRLLISYGPEKAGEARDTQFPAVAADAEKYNRADDPSACSGQEAPGLLERIERAFLG